MWELPTDEDYGCYEELVCDCICSRKQKFYLQRFSLVLVWIQFFVGAVLMSAFLERLPDTGGDELIGEGNSVRDLFIAIICLIVSISYLLSFTLGCCAVGFRCCSLLFFSTPTTIALGWLLMSGGSANNQVESTIRTVCLEYEADLKLFFRTVVDKPMCSDICPCEND